MQKYKLFGLAPPIWVAQNLYSIDIQRIIKCESKRCQSQEKVGFFTVNRQIIALYTIYVNTIALLLPEFSLLQYF